MGIVPLLEPDDFSGKSLEVAHVAMRKADDALCLCTKRYAFEQYHRS
jgi:hypothetical protein